jgi:hypothetical protein
MRTLLIGGEHGKTKRRTIPFLESIGLQVKWYWDQSAHGRIFPSSAELVFVLKDSASHGVTDRAASSAKRNGIPIITSGHGKRAMEAALGGIEMNRLPQGWSIGGGRDSRYVVKYQGRVIGKESTRAAAVSLLRTKAAEMPVPAIQPIVQEVVEPITEPAEAPEEVFDVEMTVDALNDAVYQLFLSEPWLVGQAVHEALTAIHPRHGHTWTKVRQAAAKARVALDIRATGPAVTINRNTLNQRRAEAGMEAIDLPSHRNGKALRFSDEPTVVGNRKSRAKTAPSAPLTKIEVVNTTKEEYLASRMADDVQGKQLPTVLVEITEKGLLEMINNLRRRLDTPEVRLLSGEVTTEQVVGILLREGSKAIMETFTRP